ncbi:MAG: hypothetical protein R3C49_12775 [Planctomycetaceae bacterium]
MKVPTSDAPAPTEVRPARVRTPPAEVVADPVAMPDVSEAVRLPPVKKSIAQKRERARRRAETQGIASAAVPGKTIDLRQKVMGGFRGSIDPVRTTMLYRVGVLFAALFVVLLPVLYVALVALAGYGVYWHATQNSAIASMGTGRARIMAVMLYLAPIVAGSIAVIFMLKPLLARASRRGREVSLNRAHAAAAV